MRSLVQPQPRRVLTALSMTRAAPGEDIQAGLQPNSLPVETEIWELEPGRAALGVCLCWPPWASGQARRALASHPSAWSAPQAQPGGPLRPGPCVRSRTQPSWTISVPVHHAVSPVPAPVPTTRGDRPTRPEQARQQADKSWDWGLLEISVVSGPLSHDPDTVLGAPRMSYSTHQTPGNSQRTPSHSTVFPRRPLPSNYQGPPGNSHNRAWAWGRASQVPR